MDKELILKEATMEDAQMLLEWRNDVQTKLASHNQDDVEKEEHLIWISRIINDPNRLLYVAWQKIKPDGVQAVGTCRADYCKLNDVYELSWTVAPHARGRGIGKRMVKLLVDMYSDKNIKAKVKEENIASRRIAKYAGVELDYIKDDICYYYRGAIINLDLKQIGE